MLRIMLVDDEENILRSLKRLLRGPQWEIDTFTNAHEALGALERQPYALVVSDFRMPEINGVEFLEYCKLRQPDTVRIVLSAQCDRSAVIDAINKAQIYRFISKPWDDDELVMTVRGALDNYRLLSENRRLLHDLECQRAELRRLEREHPGLTRVRWDEEGAVVLDLDE